MDLAAATSADPPPFLELHSTLCQTHLRSSAMRRTDWRKREEMGAEREGGDVRSRSGEQETGEQEMSSGGIILRPYHSALLATLIMNMCFPYLKPEPTPILLDRHLPHTSSVRFRRLADVFVMNPPLLQVTASTTSCLPKDTSPVPQHLPVLEAFAHLRSLNKPTTFGKMSIPQRSHPCKSSQAKSVSVKILITWVMLLFAGSFAICR
ncbi:hypothetical protein C8R45DRAFT_533588 [Mycena sanguinolenta]|nr:hypothetical protein C8R45DRAFT_533588 [Mycena sanguinolenta]